MQSLSTVLAVEIGFSAFMCTGGGCNTGQGRIIHELKAKLHTLHDQDWYCTIKVSMLFYTSSPLLTDTARELLQLINCVGT